MTSRNTCAHFHGPREVSFTLCRFWSLVISLISLFSSSLSLHSSLLFMLFTYSLCLISLLFWVLLLFWFSSLWSIPSSLFPRTLSWPVSSSFARSLALLLHCSPPTPRVVSFIVSCTPLTCSELSRPSHFDRLCYACLCIALWVHFVWSRCIRDVRFQNMIHLCPFFTRLWHFIIMCPFRRISNWLCAPFIENRFRVRRYV